MNASPQVEHRAVSMLVSIMGTSTLFDVEIQTGRPNWIRIHLAAAGYPLVGDRLYATTPPVELRTATES
jgi:23S rRNA-/tRNA-specific pseudouridylate synthase